jgi:two-component system, chemotaxis family, chemotaxis protein CheY
MMSKKILIVDDAIFMRTILKGILERAGYTIVGDAGDGKKAVETYKKLYESEKKPDLVLMDITMPEMNGIEALRELKRFDKEVTVVMCSSLTSQQSVVEAVKSGAKHFISKPFDEQNVIETIKKVLS